ncbi:MAG TPA: hypothetical protein VGH38_18750, partial [Bryobacteraceae bacterium]
WLCVRRRAAAPYAADSLDGARGVIPNCVGFVLYFLLRKPILHPCPGCGRGVAPDAAFCPRCGQPQMNMGPQPSREES